jgi:hypothetical protein
MFPLETNFAKTSACDLLARYSTVKRGVVRAICDFWCALIHDQPSWPICGNYYCKKCWKRFPVPWANSSRI